MLWCAAMWFFPVQVEADDMATPPVCPAK